MLDFLIPLHPKLVHFPIALFITALIFEILSRLFKKNNLSDAAVLIHYFASIFTPTVVFSGLLEAERLNLHHPILTDHKNFAFLTMWISLGSLPILWLLSWKSPKLFKNIFLIVLLAITLTITLTSHYGGKMVYDYSVGTKP